MSGRVSKPPAPPSDPSKQSFLPRPSHLCATCEELEAIEAKSTLNAPSAGVCAVMEGYSAGKGGGWELFEGMATSETMKRATSPRVCL